MANVDLEILRGLSRAAGDLYDGALDDEGKPLQIGLKREDLLSTDRKMIDGAKVIFVGDKIRVGYETQIKLKDVYQNGANAFQSEIDDVIQKVVAFLKKNYRAYTKKSVTLTPVEDEAAIKIEYVSRSTVLCCASRHYKIGGLSDILAATEKEQKSREMSDTYRKFLEQGGFGKKRPKNDTRPKNA